MVGAWVVVPCLLALRSEFNSIAPGRDKGADGTIGDGAHNSTSDHYPDEDSDYLRDHDADSKNEVHALDIDSTGPWPAGRSFDSIIKAIVARERAEYEHPTTRARLKYVIWNRQIASRSNGWVWVAYNGSDPHTNHAHFSARYETDTEADTRPWGVVQEGEDMTKDELVAFLKTDEARKLLASAVWKTDGVIPAPADSDVAKNPEWAGESYLYWDRQIIIGARQYAADALAVAQRTEVALAKVSQAVVQLAQAVAALSGQQPAPADLALLTSAASEAVRTVLRNGVNGA